MITLYKITNTINDKIYIGQTKLPIKNRWSKHRNKSSHCKLLYNAIIKYNYINFKIEEISKVETREEANIIEKELILNYNCQYPNGYNLTNGGSAFDHCQITKDKIGKSHLGKKRSLEARKNISNATKGRVISKEQKDNISKTLKGHTPVNKGKGKKVICIDTNIIYDNALSAANILNLDNIAISRVASGKRKTTGGYRFKYE